MEEEERREDKGRRRGAGRREDEGRRGGGEGEEKEKREGEKRKGEEEGRRGREKRRGEGEDDDRDALVPMRHAPRSSTPFSPHQAGDEGDPDSASPDSTATQGKAPLPPRLSAVVPCMSLLAFVPQMLMCGPLCRKCGCRTLCWHFSCRFGNPPSTGEVLLKFSTYIMLCFLIDNLLFLIL